MNEHTEVLMRTILGWRYVIRAVNEDIVEDIKQQHDIILRMPSTGDKFKALSDFKKRYGFEIENIIVLGDSNPNRALIEPYIDFNPQQGYHCFMLKGRTSTVKIHEDVISSWNCLMELMLRPTHIVIYKEK